LLFLPDLSLQYWWREMTRMMPIPRRTSNVRSNSSGMITMMVRAMAPAMARGFMVS